MLRSTLLFALCFAPSVMAQDWRIEEIGSGTKPELAVDSNGQPHIAYMIEALQGGVIFASRAGGSWPVETVAEGYFYGPLDLAVDEDDRPHIAYHDHQGTAFDPDLGDATYAFNGGAGWTVEKIAHPGHDGWHNSIAIGPEGEVHMIGVDPAQFGSADGVEWAFRSGDEWFVTPIGSGPISYEFGTGLAIDARGRPHVVYHDGSEARNDGAGSDLLYAVNDAGGWTIEAVDRAGDVGKFASIALDQGGSPHIAYLAWDNFRSGTIRYAYRDGGEWVIEEVGAVDDIEISFLGARRMTSIALDIDDRPRIAYSDKGALHYAARSGDDWAIETVTGPPVGESLGQMVSLALDEEDRAHLTYSSLPTRPSSSLGTIFYATEERPTAVAEMADQGLPESFRLVGNYPNPFNAETLIRYDLSHSAQVELAVYNLAGQRIRTLVRGQQEAGHYAVRWDGLDRADRAAATGLYLLKMRAGDGQATGKMLLLR